jgi:prepilin-type N-terminal cleavage/methylation domain-containing protein/prepilin-type processing-associated H-X9-DG protein
MKTVRISASPEVSKMGRKRGFTLIELLVVIAVIAILAAMLFPVFAQAREKARQTACLSNQKNIATAMLLYAQDYDEAIIQTFYNMPSGTNAKLRLWTTHLQPYIKNGGGNFPAEGVFKCPSFDQNRLFAGAEAAGCNNTVVRMVFGLTPFELYAHYGMANPQSQRYGSGTQTAPYFRTPGSGRDPITRQFTTVSLADVVLPTNTAIISDGATASASPSRGILSAYGCAASQMHQEGANFVFLDGHARYIKGNAESHLSQNSAGQYFMKYFTYDMQ